MPITRPSRAGSSHHALWRARAAFTLIEVAVCMVIVGVMLVAALQTVGSAADGRRRAAQLRSGQALAGQLLSEIMALPYTEPTDFENLTFGPERTDVDTPRGFDDVDDYDGFAEAPPRDRAGAVIAGYTDWKWTVSVQPLESRVDGIDRASVNKGICMVTVTAIAPSGQTTSLSSIRTKWNTTDTLSQSGRADAASIQIKAKSGDSAKEVTVSASLVNMPRVP